MKRATHKVLGVPLRLVVGRRYVASRPFASGTAGRRGPLYPVTVAAVGRSLERVDVGLMTYTHANRFLRAFNNKPGNSWAGRVWR